VLVVLVRECNGVLNFTSSVHDGMGRTTIISVDRHNRECSLKSVETIPITF
jgi:hypothetical protein